MISALNNFYINTEEPNKSCFLYLRDTILSLSDEMTPEWKYKLPFFYFKSKMFCYLWKDKKTTHPYIGIVRSKDIQHPKLIQGDRKKMKVYHINPNEDLDVEEITSILREAMTFY